MGSRVQIQHAGVLDLSLERNLIKLIEHFDLLLWALCNCRLACQNRENLLEVEGEGISQRISKSAIPAPPLPSPLPNTVVHVLPIC